MAFRSPHLHASLRAFCLGAIAYLSLSVGGLSFTGLTLYATHVRTASKRDLRDA